MIDLRAVTIRGYAVPYDKICDLGAGHGLEMFWPGAFSAFARSSYDVFLNFGTHDAPPLAKISALFEDCHGLAFEATVDCRKNGLPHSIVSSADHASIYFIRSVGEMFALDEGNVRVISSAEIEHICVCSTPAYVDTAVWVAGIELRHAPDRVRQAAERWEIGRAAWRQLAKAEAFEAAQARRLKDCRASSHAARLLTDHPPKMKEIIYG
jgi:phage head maturation protease